MLGASFESKPTDRAPVGQAPHEVVAERRLLSERGGCMKKHADGPDITLEWKVVRPDVIRTRMLRDDSFGLSHINRMQLQALCSYVGHAASGPVTMAAAATPSHAGATRDASRPVREDHGRCRCAPAHVPACAWTRGAQA